MKTGHEVVRADGARVLVLAVLPIFLAMACGDAPPETPGDPAVDIPLTLQTEDVFTVGVLAGEDWETFGRIDEVDFDAGGRLHILDAQAMRVVVVDGNGALVHTMGSEGGGPGEVSSPTDALVLNDGRVVIYDMGFPQGNFEIFGADGEFLTSVPLDPMAGTLPGGTLLPLADGRLLSESQGFRIRMAGDEAADEEPEQEDDHLRDLHAFALDGSAPELFYRAWNSPPVETPSESGEVANESGDDVDMTLNLQPAFTPPLAMGVFSDGRVALVDSIGYRIKLLDAAGNVDEGIERPIAPAPVTESVREAERARMREGLEELDMRGVSGVPPGMEEMFAAAMEQMRERSAAMVENLVFPDVVPVISTIMVDREDRIWVRRMAEDGADEGPVDIFAADGAYLGTLPPGAIELPDAFGPGGLMAYIELDEEYETPKVRVVRLVSHTTGDPVP